MLSTRLQRLKASQDTIGKARLALDEVIGHRDSNAAITGVDFRDGVLLVTTASKSLASFLLMRTSELGSLLRANGVRVSRITVR